MNSVQRKSDLHNLPVQFVAAAADADPHNPRYYAAPWVIPLTDAEVRPLCPELFDEKEKVKAAYDAATPKERVGPKCLKQALGSVSSICHRVKMAVLMLGSIPCDRHNTPLFELPPLYVKYSQFPVL